MITKKDQTRLLNAIRHLRDTIATDEKVLQDSIASSISKEEIIDNNLMMIDLMVRKLR